MNRCMFHIFFMLEKNNFFKILWSYFSLWLLKQCFLNFFVHIFEINTCIIHWWVRFRWSLFLLTKVQEAWKIRSMEKKLTKINAKQWPVFFSPCNSKLYELHRVKLIITKFKLPSVKWTERSWKFWDLSRNSKFLSIIKYRHRRPWDLMGITG